MQSTAELNSELSFTKTGYRIKAKGPSLPDYLPTAVERKDEFMPSRC